MAGYDQSLCLRDALTEYFEQNELGSDGDYAAKWVKLELLGLPLAFPNSAARRRAVKIHDLHHIVTGYDTSWTGETQISAFEIASGCGSYSAAWILNLSAFSVGLFTNPRSMFAAFRRGRRSRNLYHDTYDDGLLDTSVGQARERLALTASTPGVTGADCASFACWWTISAIASLPLLALLLSPIALLIWLLG